MIAYKEIQAHGQVDNIVPLLCHNKHLKAQQAMDEVDAIVRSAKTRFDKAAAKLAMKYPNDTIEGRQIRVFVEDLKYNMTGNQNFRYDATHESSRDSDWHKLLLSLISPRYGLADFKKGNSLIFTLWYFVMAPRANCLMSSRIMKIRYESLNVYFFWFDHGYFGHTTLVCGSH